MMSFPVDKSKVIDMRISGTWDASLPPMPIPRVSCATMVVGRYCTYDRDVVTCGEITQLLQPTQFTYLLKLECVSVTV